MIWTIDMGGGKSSCVFYEEVSPTLTTTHYGEPVVIYAIEDDITPKIDGGGIAYSLRARDYKNPLIVVYEECDRDRPLQPNPYGGVAMSIRSVRGDNEHLPCVMYEDNSIGQPPERFKGDDKTRWDSTDSV